MEHPSKSFDPQQSPLPYNPGRNSREMKHEWPLEWMNLLLQQNRLARHCQGHRHTHPHYHFHPRICRRAASLSRARHEQSGILCFCQFDLREALSQQEVVSKAAP